jgi:ectoine hydroxylase
MLSLAKEHYPSRNIDEPLLARRQEPVIWGNAAIPPCWLSPADVENYLENGFIVFSGLIANTEVLKLQAEMEHLLANFEGRQHDTVILEPGGTAVRSIFDLPSVSRVFSCLTRRHNLLRFAQYVLDSDVYLHQTRLNYKPGFEGKEFFWHSDFETWHVEDGMPEMRAVSCLVLLTDNDAMNGPLMVVPGSHRTYVGCVGTTPEENFRQSLMSQTIGTPSREALLMLAEKGGGVVPITGPAGTVAFFDCNLLHGSAGNISPYPRSNAFFVYNSVHNRLGHPLHGLRPRPEHIAHRIRAQTLRQA